MEKTKNKIKVLWDQHGNTAATVLMLVALALLVGQHWGMMLSNSDDPWIVRASLEQVLESASMQGRFWLVPINLMSALPYQSGSWIVANMTKAAVNATVFITFIVFSCRLAGKTSGLIIGTVWLALIDVSPGYYSPFHGYLMMFNLQFAVLFASFIWYLAILDKGKPKVTIVGPYALYGFALLAYEPMLFYAGVYPAMHLLRNVSVSNERMDSGAVWRMGKQFLKSNWLLPVVVILYFACYFLYRKFQPGPGRGLDAGGSPIDIAITIYRFSVNGFHFQPRALTNVIEGQTAVLNIWLSITFALALGSSMAFLLPRAKLEGRTRYLLSPIALGILAFYLLCPNLLHGFLQLYRQWAAEDPHYVGNYFSSFPFAMLIGIGLVQLVGGRKAAEEKALFGIVVALLATSACDNYVRWSNLAEINRRDASLWKAAIADLRKMTFRADQATLLCGSNAPEKVSGDDRYWSSVLSETLSSTVDYRSKNLEALPCDVKIEFNQYRFKVPSP